MTHTEKMALRAELVAYSERARERHKAEAAALDRKWREHQAAAAERLAEFDRALELALAKK